MKGGQRGVVARALRSPLVVFGLMAAVVLGAGAVMIDVTSIVRREPGTRRIAEIQSGMIKAHQPVRLDMIVVTGVTAEGFWVQDNMSPERALNGIWIAAGREWMAGHPEIKVGASVKVAGIVEEYNEGGRWRLSRTQISLERGGVTAHGTAAVPEPENVSFPLLALESNAAFVEGVVVQGSRTAGVPALVVERVDPDGGVVVTDSVSRVRLGTLMHRPNLKVGDKLDRIRGIWHTVASGYEMEPRGPEDLIALQP